MEESKSSTLFSLGLSSLSFSFPCIDTKHLAKLPYAACFFYPGNTHCPVYSTHTQLLSFSPTTIQQQPHYAQTGSTPTIHHTLTPYAGCTQYILSTAHSMNSGTFRFRRPINKLHCVNVFMLRIDCIHLF